MARWCGVIVAARLDRWPRRKPQRGCGDVFENDLERREIRRQPREDAFDEHGLPVKDIHMPVRDLAVDEERHADPLHDLKTPWISSMSVTPWLELVVAWAG